MLVTYVLACANLRSYHSMRDIHCGRDLGNIDSRELELEDLQSRIACRTTAPLPEHSHSPATVVPLVAASENATCELGSKNAALRARLASALDIMNNFSDSLVYFDSLHETKALLVQPRLHRPLYLLLRPTAPSCKSAALAKTARPAALRSRRFARLVHVLTQNFSRKPKPTTPSPRKKNGACRRQAIDLGRSW